MASHKHRKTWPARCRQWWDSQISRKYSAGPQMMSLGNALINYKETLDITAIWSHFQSTLEQEYGDVR